MDSQAAETPASLLLVDDEPSILSSLRRLLRPAGYIIHTAENGKAGLEILEKETIDLIISDMRMPEMDGAEFLERVRNRWPATTRILLTGHADMSSTIAAINRGEIHRLSPLVNHGQGKPQLRCHLLRTASLKDFPQDFMRLHGTSFRKPSRFGKAEPRPGSR